MQKQQHANYLLFVVGLLTVYPFYNAEIIPVQAALSFSEENLTTTRTYIFGHVVIIRLHATVAAIE